MRYAVVFEPIREAEKMPGYYQAHVPTLGLTTHGLGIEGAMAAARDLVVLWLEEKRANGESVLPATESILATIEVE